MHKCNYKKYLYRQNDTFTSLQKLRKNKDIIILSADKESCTVIFNKSDYVRKVDQMIEDDITEGNYIETSDNTLCDLKRFQVFLYCHLYKHKDYEAMRPRSNRPGRFFATAKTHKIKSIQDIFLESLKLRPIIVQTGTYIYNTSKVVAKYLSPLSKNEFSITDTLSFPELLKNSSNDESYEDVSYDVESLFTSIPVQETIDYILQKTYVRKEIKPLCKKLIFKKLLLILTKECVFSLNNRLIKQIDDCPMGDPIFVVFFRYLCL